MGLAQENCSVAAVVIAAAQANYFADKKTGAQNSGWHDTPY
jgi:hypothetical protein